MSAARGGSGGCTIHQLIREPVLNFHGQVRRPRETTILPRNRTREKYIDCFTTCGLHLLRLQQYHVPPLIIDQHPTFPTLSALDWVSCIISLNSCPVLYDHHQVHTRHPSFNHFNTMAKLFLDPPERSSSFLKVIVRFPDSASQRHK